MEGGQACKRIKSKATERWPNELKAGLNALFSNRLGGMGLEIVAIGRRGHSHSGGIKGKSRKGTKVLKY